MNDIVRRVIDDGLCGFDSYGQIWCWTLDPRDPESRRGTIVHDVRGKLCAICNHPWSLETSSAFGDQFFWDLVKAPVHRGCFARHLGLNDRREFTDALVHAKFRFAGLIPIANGYWPRADWMAARPWYRAEHLDRAVALEIGWRKRVIEIRAVPTDGKPFSWVATAETLFAGEDVTKGFAPLEVFLHAWGIAKARAYLEQLAQIGCFAQIYDEKRPGWAVYGDGYAIDKYAKSKTT
jgi:hypothetical protein